MFHLFLKLITYLQRKLLLSVYSRSQLFRNDYLEKEKLINNLPHYIVKISRKEALIVLEEIYFSHTYLQI